MSEDLDFAALHSDDALLDALGSRVVGASLGVAPGLRPTASPDVMARLLGAYTNEIDTRPGPLTDLLATAGPTATAAAVDGAIPRRSDRALAAVSVADRSAGETHSAVPATRRRGRVVVPRAVAIGAVGSLVLGLGGVAAAVSNGGPLADIRRAVSSVTHTATPQRTPAERATKMLEKAEEAMNDGDLKTAGDRLAQVQRLLPLISDPDIMRTLQGDLDKLRQRLQGLAPANTVAVVRPGAQSGPATPAGVSAAPTKPGVASTRGPASASPTSQTLVPGAGVEDPTTGLSTVNDSPVGAAKDDLKNRAKEKLGNPLHQPAPLPNQPLPGGLPAPVGGLRGPMSSDIARKVGAVVVLSNISKGPLAEPDPAAVAAGAVNGPQHH